MHFTKQFPADFISEAIDQTRGWFYAQLAISTLMFGSKSKKPSPYPHPFRNCIVLGHMLGEDGQKMCKRKRNYLPPDEIFDRYGADALRWFFFASQPPWTTIRYNEQAIKDSIPEFLLRLWNVYSFFVIYANIDEFDPAAEGCRMSDAGSREIGAKLLSTAKSYRPVKEARRAGSLDFERAQSDVRGGCRADGRLRQLWGVPTDYGIRRCTLELVRAAESRSILGG